MASSKERQRRLARAKLDRQMARRAAQERRRRRVLAGFGAIAALVLIAGGVAWIGGAFDKSEPTDTSAQDTCNWSPMSTTNNTSLKEVGTPPTKQPTSGTETMSINTNQGTPIVVSLDVANAPCSAADLRFLAGKKFYDNTDCHEITTDGAVRCGDPSGTGQGGPTYSIFDENVPTPPDPSASASAGATPPLYPKGTVALIGSPPNTNGSQFLIFFKDFNPPTPAYPIVGKVTGGLDTLAKIGTIPTVANAVGEKVKPTKKITITSLSVGDAATAAPSASAQS